MLREDSGARNTTEIPFRFETSLEHYETRIEVRVHTQASCNILIEIITKVLCDTIVKFLIKSCYYC